MLAPRTVPIVGEGNAPPITRPMIAVVDSDGLPKKSHNDSTEKYRLDFQETTEDGQYFPCFIPPENIFRPM